MAQCSWNISNYATSKLVTDLFSDWPLDASPLFGSINLFLAEKLLMGWKLALKAQFTPTPHSFDPWNILLLLNLIFQAY